MQTNIEILDEMQIEYDTFVLEIYWHFTKRKEKLEKYV